MRLLCTSISALAPSEGKGHAASGNILAAPSVQDAGSGVGADRGGDDIGAVGVGGGGGGALRRMPLNTSAASPVGPRHPNINSNNHNNNPVPSPVRKPSVSNGRPVDLVGSGGSVRNRRNTSIGSGQAISPQSAVDGDDVEGSEEKRKHPVKRACNECRQQKVGLHVSYIPTYTLI